MDRRLYTHLTTVAALGLFFLPLPPLLYGPLILAAILAMPSVSDAEALGLRGTKTIDWVLVPVLVGLTVGFGILVPSDGAPEAPHTIGAYLLLCLAVVTAAASEELLFRSLVLSAYPPVFGTAPVVLAASVLFAAGHLGQGLPAALYALAVGILYSMVFLKRRNFWILAAAHGIHNILALPLPDIR